MGVEADAKPLSVLHAGPDQSCSPAGFANHVLVRRWLLHLRTSLKSIAPCCTFDQAMAMTPLMRAGCK